MFFILTLVGGGSEVQGPACRFPFDTKYWWSLFQGVWLAPCAVHTRSKGLGYINYMGVERVVLTFDSFGYHIQDWVVSNGCSKSTIITFYLHKDFTNRMIKCCCHRKPLSFFIKERLRLWFNMQKLMLDNIQYVNQDIIAKLPFQKFSHHNFLCTLRLYKHFLQRGIYCVYLHKVT